MIFISNVPTKIPTSYNRFPNLFHELQFSIGVKDLPRNSWLKQKTKRRLNYYIFSSGSTKEVCQKVYLNNCYSTLKFIFSLYKTHFFFRAAKIFSFTLFSAFFYISFYLTKIFLYSLNIYITIPQNSITSFLSYPSKKSYKKTLF